MNKYQRLQKWVFKMAVNTGHTTNVDKEYHDLLQELVDTATPKNVTSEMLWVNIYEYNCPLCEEKVDKTDYYCRQCGQRLDCSEDE